MPIIDIQVINRNGIRYEMSGNIPDLYHPGTSLQDDAEIKQLPRLTLWRWGRQVMACWVLLHAIICQLRTAQAEQPEKFAALFGKRLLFGDCRLKRGDVIELYPEGE